MHLCSGGHLEPSLNLLGNLFQPLAAGVPVLLHVALVEKIQDCLCQLIPAQPSLAPRKHPVPLILARLRVQAHLSSSTLSAPPKQFTSLSDSLAL